jgi:alpha-L-arabinofuranosidase
MDCALSGMAAKSVAALSLAHADINAANTFDHPDSVTPKACTARVDGGVVRLELPRLSVVTARINIG